MVSLSRKTSCAAQVALQHCPILHMSKRKSMIPTGFHTVNWLNPLRKPGSKPSGQVAQLAPDRRLRRTGISNSSPALGRKGDSEMRNVAELFTNPYLLCSLSAWGAAQGIKYLRNGIFHHQWNVRQWLNSGDFPSSHTAATVSLAFLIGFREGFTSSLFALSFVFSVVIMYDAMGVRRETGKQAVLIKQLMKINLSEEEVAIAEKIGHTPKEVAAGAVLGVLLALLFASF